MVILAGWLVPAAVQGGFIPARIDGGVPDSHGFLVPALLTPLSATLLHGGFAHLALNLVMLVFCGRQVERVTGPAGLLILYLVGAFAGAGGQWLFEPGSRVPMIGASGAISAIVGAYALLFGERRAKRWGPVPGDLLHVLWLAAAWIGIQFLIGIAGMGGVTVAIGAHIGGFIAGLALARPLLLWRYREA